MSRVLSLLGLLVLSLGSSHVAAFVPLIDGGKDMPKMYQAYFDDQIAKQASTAIGKAVSAGIKKMEVNFPPVPNVEEVRFGTPLNKKFGTKVVSNAIRFKGGYQPGSDLSRQLVAYSNMFWSKKLASSLGGGLVGGSNVAVLSAEPVNFKLVQDLGVSRASALTMQAKPDSSKKDAIIAVNPGGEEQWERIRSAHAPNNTPFMVLNNSYSTTYDLGNKRDYEEVYYLKRISKGWIFRAYPGPWKAYLEKPDGTVELMQTYKTKPSLKEVAGVVRDESFKRYAINNDRWFSGRL